ncbi:MAG: B12-binding domain-containing radical SAM protein [bacterium]
MKIGLISPKANFLSRNSEFQEFWSKSKHTEVFRQRWSGIGSGLLVVAGLTPQSFEVEVIDENLEEVDFSRKYDLVGITAMTNQALRAYKISDNFRNRGIKVVIGGIHSTVLPEEAMQHADSVVVGGAEYLWPELLADFQDNKLKPVYKSEKPVDLKDSPLPRYDLLKSKSYRIIWIQTTRGCPHDCEFCAATSVFGRKYRHKSIEQIINEIRFIKKLFGKTFIGFGDDNFLVDKKFCQSLLERIVPLKIRWFAETDISIARDDKLLHLLRKSGCFFLFIGFETISEEGLKTINRNGWKFRQLKYYSSFIKKIQSYGIGVMGAFIIGLDSDDASIFTKISNFIIENNLYDAQISVLTPLPGTRLRARLEKEGRLLRTNWENFSVFDVNFIHPKLTKHELEKGLCEIYKNINSKEVYLKRMRYHKEILKELMEV